MIQFTNKGKWISAAFALSMLSNVGSASAAGVNAAASGATPASGAKKTDLSAAATNPLASLMSFRLQAQVSSYYNAEGESVTGLFQGVFPFETGLSWAPTYINRTTVPYTSTAKLGSDKERHVGLADTAVLNFLIHDGKVLGGTVGYGLALTIPTAGDNEETGQGQWQAGPNLAYMNANTPTWQWGALVFSQHDFANTRGDAADVSVGNFQPILTKHFKEGWYVSAPDLPQTYNFKTNKWALNLGPVVGRVFSWGKQPVQVYAGAYYNTEDNDYVATQMTYKLNISFLIPK